MAVSKEIEGEKGHQLYSGGKAVGDTGVAGVDKGSSDLVEGNDGEWRAKR